MADPVLVTPADIGYLVPFSVYAPEYRLFVSDLAEKFLLIARAKGKTPNIVGRPLAPRDMTAASLPSGYTVPTNDTWQTQSAITANTLSRLYYAKPTTAQAMVIFGIANLSQNPQTVRMQIKNGDGTPLWDAPIYDLYEDSRLHSGLIRPPLWAFENDVLDVYGVSPVTTAETLVLLGFFYGAGIGIAPPNLHALYQQILGMGGMS